jgi:hypothetical protein
MVVKIQNLLDILKFVLKHCVSVLERVNFEARLKEYYPVVKKLNKELEEECNRFATEYDMNDVYAEIFAYRIQDDDKNNYPLLKHVEDVLNKGLYNNSLKIESILLKLKDKLELYDKYMNELLPKKEHVWGHDQFKYSCKFSDVVEEIYHLVGDLIKEIKVFRL